MRLIDVTPQNLESVDSSELQELWKKLSLIWEVENVNKDEIIGRAIYIINEANRRKIEIEKTALYSAVESYKASHQESYDIQEAVRQPFGSPGGKRYMADRLVRMLPEHKVYVEVFTGGAACFWKKKPSDKEIINDKDSHERRSSIFG